MTRCAPSLMRRLSRRIRKSRRNGSNFFRRNELSDIRREPVHIPHRSYMDPRSNGIPDIRSGLRNTHYRDSVIVCYCFDNACYRHPLSYDDCDTKPTTNNDKTVYHNNTVPDRLTGSNPLIQQIADTSPALFEVFFLCQTGILGKRSPELIFKRMGVIEGCADRISLRRILDVIRAAVMAVGSRLKTLQLQETRLPIMLYTARNRRRKGCLT